MFSLKKRYVVALGILGGLGIANQDTLQSSWSRLNQFVSQTRDWKFFSQSPPKTAYPFGAAMQPPSDFDTWSSVQVAANSSTARDGNSQFPSTLTASTKFSHPQSDAMSKMVSSNNSVQLSRSSADHFKIRIATFNLDAFGESKLSKAAVVESIALLIRKFDVVAIQHIQSKQHNILPAFIDQVNISDRRYEYCIGPRVGPEGNQQQFAFVFDSDRIETDRQMLYTVEDPQHMLTYDPLVGWFRAKAVATSQAFTFSLVNLRIDPLHEARERKALTDLVRSVQQDGRLEDDVILAGDFGCSERELSDLSRSGMVFALEGTPTTITGEAMLDNIVFPVRATDEFTGRAGVIDFLRQGNLSIDQAFQISTHMPAWAEFSAFEGGEHSRQTGP